MPFNRAVMMAGPRTFILDSITSEDLDFSYDVEAQVISKFGISGTIAGDNIILNIAAIKLVTGSVSGLDASDLHDNAIFTINIVAGTKILGGGGNGGEGGDSFFDQEPPNLGNSAQAGTDGGSGLTPIRLGCVTFIKGAAGNIELGYGAGGGGGGDYGPPAGGGGGGGGGAPLGTFRGKGGGAGTGENGAPSSGTAGNDATETTKGIGGAGSEDAGAGGNGAESGTAAQVGVNGNAPGGSAGSNGGAIDKQGFDLTVDGGITVIGAVA